nr:immunoglobulin heavy chain junction region [Mus musculus]
CTRSFYDGYRYYAMDYW